MPVKIGGRYHLPGKIAGSSKEQIFASLAKLKPVFDLLRGDKIFISPLPRYTHTACCQIEGHCVGVGTVGHAANMANISNAVRKLTRDFLHSRVSKVWVPDVLGMLLPDQSTDSVIDDRLRSMYSKDGVHLTVEGYKVLTGIYDSLIANKMSVQNSVSGSSAVSGRNKTFFWKGFVSPVGSSRPDNLSSLHKNRAIGKRHTGSFHPYAKKK